MKAHVVASHCSRLNNRLRIAGRGTQGWPLMHWVVITIVNTAVIIAIVAH
jgi:hypothetical protein